MAKIQYRYHFNGKHTKIGCGSIALLAVLFYIAWVLVFAGLIFL